MDRRHFGHLSLLSLLGYLAPRDGGKRRRPAGSRARLFFDQSDIDRIRANASTPLLRPTFERWAGHDLAESAAIIRKPLQTGRLLTDFGAALTRTQELAMMALITGDQKYEDILKIFISVTNEMPVWDAMREGDEVLGLQRSSKATTTLLFILEVLGDAISAAKRKQILDDVAEKGVVPCNLAVWSMDNPHLVKGWSFDELHREAYSYDLTNWPTILGRINLRAIPTMGLGLGALALDGTDPRADEWLARAVRSAQTFLGYFSRDGSYFEGLSYVDYAFRTLFLFLEAHHRVIGDVDWAAYANLRGVAEFIATMQLGTNAESGEPDIVNISDARHSVTVTVPAWIARHTGDSLAQYDAEQFSRSFYFADFLWYDPAIASAAPPPSLLNKRNDLDWIVSRSGWADDDAVLAFRSGLPANHEHADRNHITFKYSGERLLTDQFGASYDPRQAHWLLRQTAAHNCVLVDGEGHHYVDGSEGTNTGKAIATIVDYVDRGDRVWWVSDATHGYKLLNSDIQLVRRSVFFEKPGFIIVVDELEKRTAPSRFVARYFPDNRDGEAIVTQSGISRPTARFDVGYASNQPVTSAAHTLDLPAEYGIFPYLELEAGPALRTTLIAVLSASAGAGTARRTPGIVSDDNARAWLVTRGEGDGHVLIDVSGSTPSFRPDTR